MQGRSTQKLKCVKGFQLSCLRQGKWQEQAQGLQTLRKSPIHHFLALCSARRCNTTWNQSHYCQMKWGQQKYLQYAQFQYRTKCKSGKYKHQPKQCFQCSRRPFSNPYMIINCVLPKNMGNPLVIQNSHTTPIQPHLSSPSHWCSLHFEFSLLVYPTYQWGGFCSVLASFTAASTSKSAFNSCPSYNNRGNCTLPPFLIPYLILIILWQA